MLLNIAKPIKSPHPVLNLGFRIFFISAAAFAVVSMLAWHLLLIGKVSLVQPLNPIYWHAHEMIFGYACAVIAGFLLTAVKTWTGVQMPAGWRLFWVWLPWLVARLLFLALLFDGITPDVAMLAMVCDLVFWFLMSFAVIRAVVLSRNKRQAGIIAKLILLFICQIVFALSVASEQAAWQQMALYFALFLVIGVVLTIGRRVLPFFIDKGVAVDCSGKPNGVQANLRNSLLVDRLSLISFAALTVSYLTAFTAAIAPLAILTALINAWRLVGWHHSGIWKKPLLWSLYLSFWGMVAAFALMAALSLTGQSPSLALHALALTGIGLITLAMMARVSLGHTGRSIHQPPKVVSAIFILMIICAILRVAAPMFGDLLGDYLQIISYSQACWVASFVLFLLAYTKMLMRPRVDGIMG